MVFKCQEDSFLKEYESKVLRCEETRDPIVEYGKLSTFEGYQVILENTILFPAGGGQPHDIGFLNEHEVLQVTRRGDEALHFVKEPLKVGTVVNQRINWDRRFDHMQQHSGQHLLSAILEKKHNLPTNSWWLGAEESYVELQTSQVTEDVIRQVEDRCNELIRRSIPVEVKFYKGDDPALSEAHTRGLPKDCMETKRVIHIGDIDENLCCGTHVTNLSQLQMIKLIGTEPGKKGAVNLKFLVGSRVVSSFQRMLDRERALTGLLKNEPSKHEDLVLKLQNNLKVTRKNLQNTLNEIVENEIVKYKSTKPKYIALFKKEATPEFNRALCKGLEKEDIFLCLVSEEPDKPKECQVLILGNGEETKDLVQQLVKILNAKGTVLKNGIFQGKGDLSQFNKCKKHLEDHFREHEK